MQAADAATTDLAERLVGAVREAGALALSKFGVPVKIWTKGRDSPVCEADIAVDKLLRERLADIAPDYGWLSEESEDDQTRLAVPRVWVVDPIDGTRAFITRRDDWVISAALVEAGRPIAAAIFAPVTNELFVAVKGRGATLNDRPLQASTGDRLAGARIAGPRPYLDQLAAHEPAIKMVPKVFSLALRLARVAADTLDAAFASSDSHDWDLAAADLLVHEAGGMLTTLQGRLLTYNRPHPVHSALVAAGRARHATLIGLVRDGAAGFA